MIYAFTSVTGSYLANARVLARSVRAHHPDWKFVLLLNDAKPSAASGDEKEFDEVVLAEELPIADFRRWSFDRTVVEFCTGTKPTMTSFLFDERGADLVVYLDPDTALFSPLVEIPALLETHDVILTPHLTDAEDTDYGIWSHEMAALKHGTFNLGFYAVANRKSGREFLAWWENRCLTRGTIDFMSGLFVDQKWCNLAPYLFDGIHVLCDRAYNVATWNMKNREISRTEDGAWLVNGEPLRFYHFSGFGNDFSWANEELRKFLKENTGLEEIWDWYKERYEQHRLPEAAPWRWGAFDDGTPISPAERQLYGENEALRERYPDPYVAEAMRAIREAVAASAASAATEAAAEPAAGESPRGLLGYLRAGLRDPGRGIRMLRNAASIVRKEGLAGVRQRLDGRNA